MQISVLNLQKFLILQSLVLGLRFRNTVGLYEGWKAQISASPSCQGFCAFCSFSTSFVSTPRLFNSFFEVKLVTVSTFNMGIVHVNTVNNVQSVAVWFPCGVYTCAPCVCACRGYLCSLGAGWAWGLGLWQPCCSQAVGSSLLHFPLKSWACWIGVTRVSRSSFKWLQLGRRGRGLRRLGAGYSLLNREENDNTEFHLSV